MDKGNVLVIGSSDVEKSIWMNVSQDNFKELDDYPYREARTFVRRKVE